ncbi:MAG TPA: ATP-binding protein [Vicinamibacterales bacterium]|nr:ATP-binding protein [Vicinamibacterales bacterium]
MTMCAEPIDAVTLARATLRWFDDYAVGGIFTTDTELRIRTWNQWLFDATGILAQTAIGRPLFDVVPTLRERGFDRSYDEALRGEIKVLSHAFHRYILPTCSPAGEQMPQSGRIAPLLDSGVVVGTITVISDVSERVAVERELRAQIATAEAARQQAEDASRVKDDFLATLSHEIRTPLNAVLGWTRILRSRTPDAKMLERAIEVIERNAGAQLTLVTDMLDMARITAGKVRLELHELDLGATVASAVDVIRPAADAKGIQLNTDLAGDTPLVRGDEDRLLQVFWNLLSNAVKFTDAGGHITLRLASTGAAVRVSIIDTGQGISPQFLPHVFQRFKQADPSAARRHGGLGLGLALVREIVHLHGGSVDVQSAGLQQGTTVTVTLPACRVVERAQARPRTTSVAQLKGIRILVLEDDPDARDIVATAVTDAGGSVTAVASVEEALGALREQNNERPQVVIADIGLPGADGYMFISELRRMPADAGGMLPVIAVTAYATSHDRRMALDAGFSAHVAKPFVPEHLVTTIARAIETSV